MSRAGGGEGVLIAFQNVQISCCLCKLAKIGGSVEYCFCRVFRSATFEGRSGSSEWLKSMLPADKVVEPTRDGGCPCNALSCEVSTEH